MHELSVNLCYACGYCFDLMLCENIDFFSKKLVRGIKCKQKPCITWTITMMQTRKKLIFLFSRLRLYSCRFSFATSTHVCSILSIDFVKQAWIECCFWSAHCIETQARTFEIVKFGFFFRLLYNDGILQKLLCIATFYVETKLHFLN